MPAAARCSLDAWMRKGSGLIPRWPLVLLRAQLVIAYFFVGFSKLSADWMLDAVPVRWYLAKPEVTAPYWTRTGRSVWAGSFESGCGFDPIWVG